MFYDFPCPGHLLTIRASDKYPLKNKPEQIEVCLA
jgi:hypothetical protein